MIEHRSPVDGSGGPPDNINRGTVLLGWAISRRDKLSDDDPSDRLQREKDFQ